MGFAGGGAGRRDSGVRRVDDYRGTYETVGRIEKSGDEPGFYGRDRRPRNGINRLRLSGSRLRLSGIGSKRPRFDNVDALNCRMHNSRNWRLERCPFA